MHCEPPIPRLRSRPQLRQTAQSSWVGIFDFSELRSEEQRLLILRLLLPRPRRLFRNTLRAEAGADVRDVRRPGRTRRRQRRHVRQATRWRRAPLIEERRRAHLVCQLRGGVAHTVVFGEIDSVASCCLGDLVLFDFFTLRQADEVGDVVFF
jgi:hypothetical protein